MQGDDSKSFVFSARWILNARVLNLYAELLSLAYAQSLGVKSMFEHAQRAELHRRKLAADLPRAARTMRSMVAGTFRLPWEDKVKITNGTSCGFQAPTRGSAGRRRRPSEGRPSPTVIASQPVARMRARR